VVVEVLRLVGWTGLVPNLVGVTPEKAIKLAANDLFREYFEHPDGSIAFHHELLSGALAGACQVVATVTLPPLSSKDIPFRL
jgi:hypothetical protein